MEAPKSAWRPLWPLGSVVALLDYPRPTLAWKASAFRIRVRRTTLAPLKDSLGLLACSAVMDWLVPQLSLLKECRRPGICFQRGIACRCAAAARGHQTFRSSTLLWFQMVSLRALPSSLGWGLLLAPTGGHSTILETCSNQQTLSSPPTSIQLGPTMPAN